MKYYCCKCAFKAVWYYAPWTSMKVEEDNYYCERHVHRGCSCNIIDEEYLEYDAANPYKEHLDKLGRRKPCCEYDYNKNGFSIEDE